MVARGRACLGRMKGVTNTKVSVRPKLKRFALSLGAERYAIFLLQVQREDVEHY